jgi:hypothetical protein
MSALQRRPHARSVRAAAAISAGAGHKRYHGREGWPAKNEKARGGGDPAGFLWSISEASPIGHKLLEREIVLRRADRNHLAL